MSKHTLKACLIHREFGTEIRLFLSPKDVKGIENASALDIDVSNIDSSKIEFVELEDELLKIFNKIIERI